MRISARTTRIIAASGLALSFMGVSYVISGPSIFFKTNSANAESTEALLASYAAKDTDGDGLPDWQEALYGTDPNKAISNSFGVPDGEAAQKGLLTPNALKNQLPVADTATVLTNEDLPVPDAASGSITDEFSKEFLQDYFQATNGQPMTADAQQALLQTLVQNFSAKAAVKLSSQYSSVSVHTNTSTSLTSYVSVIETTFQSHNISDLNGDPISLMHALLVDGNDKAAPKLMAISKAYGAMAADLRATKVPPSMIPTHVALVKSLEQLSLSTAIVSNYKKDPLGTMGALSVYSASTKSFADTLSSIANTILVSGEPQEGQAGYLLVNIARISTL
ncbi:MAG: hypothetical protein JWN49_15 [Parcubacteria group bacterium]|nr:hypothetical protein [Parcubacteria group bacterium]